MSVLGSFTRHHMAPCWVRKASKDVCLLPSLKLIWGTTLPRFVSPTWESLTGSPKRARASFPTLSAVRRGEARQCVAGTKHALCDDWLGQFLNFSFASSSHSSFFSSQFFNLYIEIVLCVLLCVWRGRLGLRGGSLFHAWKEGLNPPPPPPAIQKPSL